MSSIEGVCVQARALFKDIHNAYNRRELKPADNKKLEILYYSVGGT